MSTEIIQPQLQGWSDVANPGKADLAKVNYFDAFNRLMSVSSVIAICLVCAAVFVPALLSLGLGSAAGWMGTKLEKLTATKPMDPVPAPAMKQLVAVLPKADFDPAAVPEMNAASVQMQARVTAFGAGKVTDCNSNTKITDAWVGVDATGNAVDFAPRCRYSADGSRLWVWQFVNDQGNFTTYMGLIRKTEAKDVLLTVALPGSIQKLYGVGNQNLDLVPRSLAQDFPELLTNQNK